MSPPRHYADRVKETTTSTGTGNITLAGAAQRFRSFNSAFGLDKHFDYCIEAETGDDWEIGLGYLSGTTTLVRVQIHSSSNSNNAVNFAAGTKQVYNIHSAIRAQRTSMKGRMLAKVAGYDLS